LSGRSYPVKSTNIILSAPFSFTVKVIKSFFANQGLLLAGAVAYYTLLSIIPLFSLLLIALSHVLDQASLLATLTRYLEFAVPGESAPLIAQITAVLENRDVVSWVLIGVLLFFSSMAFSVLENAMSVIFYHRLGVRHRHFMISVIIPYLFILLLGIGFLTVTLMAGVLLAVEDTQLNVLGVIVPLDTVSRWLLYLIGLSGQILILSAIYLVMPVGNLSVRRALLGGITAGLLWEVSRHILVWYFATLSLVNVVYGSLATTIVALLTLEVASIILLLGAQVMAEYEQHSLARKRELQAAAAQN
jgi:YihY family inner membrane protein